MKIGLVSDLHLEFRWNNLRAEETWSRLADKINAADCDFVVNAGDIHPDPRARDYFHSKIKVQYFHNLGNHDFYGGQYLAPSRYVFTYGGKKIVGVTLWTDFNKGDPLVMLQFKRALADGTQIRPPQGLRIEDAIYKQHKEDLAFIEAEKPDVVIAHHAPSSLSVAERFKASGWVNYYFMSDLENFLLDNGNIKMFCHGHMHNESDYMIGGCRVVANPLGYPGERFKTVDPYQVQILEV